MTLARRIVIAIVVLCSVVAADELPLPPHPRYVFQHVGDDLGLSTTTPAALFQDRDGFIWIGTQAGLYRYDGADVTRFTTADGLPSDFIDQIGQAPNGTLWIGTRKGVAYFASGKFVAPKMPFETAKVGQVYQIFAIDQQSSIYVATDHGLVRYRPTDPDHPQIWNSVNGMPAAQVDAVYVASDGVVWFASGHRVGRLDLKGNVALLPTEAGVPQDDVVCILRDGDGTLWLRTYNKLLRLDPGADRFVEDDAGLPRANDFGMPIIDRSGELAIPTVAGIFRKSGGRWSSVGARQGMGVNAAFALMEDVEGAYWVGLGGAGIERWPGARNWKGWIEGDGLPDNVVWAVLRDKQQRLWVGTNTGLALFDGKSDKPRVWNEKSGLNGSTVRQLTLAPDGAVWVLCYPGGLTRFDSTKLQPEKIDSPLPNPTTVRSVPDGRIWISNHAYLKVYDPAKKSFDDVPVPADIVGTTSHIELAPDGTLWAGGAKGLVRYDGKEWLHLTVKNGLRGDVISELAPISANEVWVRYDESLGITHVELKDGKPVMTHYGAGHGLHSNELYLLAADRDGNIWVGSGHGLTRITRDLHFRRFTRADGLLWDDLSANAFLAESDGTLLFGTSGGLARFDPRAGIPDVAPPRVLLTSARLGGHEYLGAAPEVVHRDGTLQAHFAVLSYRDPSAVKCRERLNGLEDKFDDVATHEIRYPALPSGNYTLEVTCSSGDTAGNTASFSFVVQPAWWERWWTQGLGILLAVVIVVLIIRARTNKLERERRRLEDAVASRSAALAAANVELKEASLTDPLTKVRNRRFFDLIIGADVNQTVRAYAPGTSSKAIRNRDLIFYLVDIDHFKQVNDVYGHDAGDAMLAEIAQRIGGVMRQSDVLMRWGGEEFLIVSRSAERTEAEILAKRILDAVGSRLYNVGPEHPRIFRTCSIGWAPFPWFVAMPGGIRYEEVLKLADRALYMAKDAGRNQAFGLMPTSADPIYLPRPEAGWRDLNSDSERIPVQPLRTAGPDVGNAGALEARAT